MLAIERMAAIVERLGARAPEAPAADFVIHGPAETGVPGYAALYGIESPGLTASLAIADALAEKLGLTETPRALA